MHNKYKDKGLVVIGANPFNNDEKDLKRMPNFLAHNPIDYQIMHIERAKAYDFNIYGYPTFYVIDSEGTVVHSDVGFSERATIMIDSLIQENVQ